MLLTQSEEMIKSMKSRLLKNKQYSILKITCFWILFIISTSSLQAAKDFEGEITYRITYEDGIQEQLLEVLPKQATLLVKNQKFYSYTNGPLGHQGLIYDYKKEVSYTLVDFFSSAIAIKRNKIDILKDRDLFTIQSIQHTEESKLILGYSCRLIIVTVYIPKLKQNIELRAFYTTTLGNTDWINEADPIYYQIKGTLLEYEIQMGNVFMQYKASEIKNNKLSENELKIPKTYKVVNSEEAGQYLKNQ